MSPIARRALHLLEITTVGIPFCVFKLLLGGVLAAMPAWRALGVAIVALGMIDLVLNAANFTLTLVGRESPVPVCTAQWLVDRARHRRQPWRELGLSVDAMLSFTLVASMIGFGLLARLSRADLGTWNVCVVLNVLGAGLGRLAETVLERRPEGVVAPVAPRTERG